MNKFEKILFSILVFLVLFLIFGLGPVINRVNSNACIETGEVTGLSTSYFSGACHIDVCGTWVAEDELYLHVNRMLEGCN